MPKYNSIALAGLPRSGKSTLTNLLSKSLGWPVYSIGSIFRERYEAWLIGDQKRKNITFESFFSDYVLDKEIKEVNMNAREQLIKGEIILDSRYAALNVMVLSNVLLAFLKAPLSIRAERSLELYARNTLKDIESILKNREKDEIRRGREFALETYNLPFDCTNENLYPFILDSSVLSPKEELEKVLSALNS